MKFIYNPCKCKCIIFIYICVSLSVNVEYEMCKSSVKSCKFILCCVKQCKCKKNKFI